MTFICAMTVEVPGMGEEQLDLAIRDTDVGKVSVVEGKLQSRSEFNQVHELFRGIDVRSYVSLYREQRVVFCRCINPPLESFCGTPDGLLPAFVSKANTWQHGNTWSAQTTCHLDHIMEECGGVILLFWVRMVRSHRFEVGPGLEEEVAEFQAGALNTLF